jgi:hypothetical protein
MNKIKRIVLTLCAVLFIVGVAFGADTNVTTTAGSNVTTIGSAMPTDNTTTGNMTGNVTVTPVETTIEQTVTAVETTTVETATETPTGTPVNTPKSPGFEIVGAIMVLSTLYIIGKRR